MDYLRVPVTDEKAPKADDFAVLISRAWPPPPGAALVFNCQVRLTWMMFLLDMVFPILLVVLQCVLQTETPYRDTRPFEQA